jgi:hypothetical protein
MIPTDNRTRIEAPTASLIGYNHSVRCALDGVMVTLAFNANGLFRKITNY